MKTATQELIHEHDEILTAIDVLEKIKQQSGNPDKKDVNDIIKFMKEFVDECHHEKEEHYYFPTVDDEVEDLQELTEELTDEHDEARDILEEMEESAEDDEMDIKAFNAAADSFIELMRHHIEEENTKLFPEADKKLLQSKQDELLAEFEEFEEKELGTDKHNQLHILLKNLKEKYLKGE